jgi:hypothetical protein
MRKLHERIELERQFKTDMEIRMQKEEKIELEKQLLVKREEERKAMQDYKKQQEMGLRVKEQ